MGTQRETGAAWCWHCSVTRRSVLALPGIWAAFQRNALLTLAVGAGMVATVAVLFLLPPFLHHYTLLMPFLALFGGIGIWHAIEFLANATRGASARAHQQRFGWEWLYLGVFGCAAIVAASQSFTLAQRDLEVMMLDTPSALERCRLCEEVKSSRTSLC